MIEFVHSEFFWLLPLPLLMRLMPPFRQQQSSLRVPFLNRIAELTGQKKKRAALVKSRTKIQKLLLPLTWLCLVIAVAKPEYIGDPIEQTKAGRDLMIAVDLSGSMMTTDFTLPDGQQVDRLKAVKWMLSDFVEDRKGDRLGLIVFADAPYLQVPFSEDRKTLLALLNEVEIGMAGQRTVFGDAIGLAIKLFKNSDSQDKAMVVLTDGNDTGSLVPPLEAARIAAANDVKIYIIAVGDPTATGEEAMDMATIEEVVRLTGGQQFQALDSDQLKAASDSINQLEQQTFDTLSYRPHTSLHHYPIILPALLYLLFHGFMALQLFMGRRKIASPIEPQPATREDSKHV